MADELKSDLLARVLTGKTEREIADIIAARYQTSQFNARRLVQTETTYVVGQAELQAFKEAGAEKYEFSALLDEATSVICRELDGKKFPVSEARPGENYPPMHPFCRSVTVADLPSEEELDKRWNDSADELGLDLPFDEWVKHLHTAPDGKMRYVKDLSETLDKSARRDTISQAAKKDKQAPKGLTKSGNGSIIKIEKQRGIEPDMNIDSSAVQNDKHTAAGNRRSPFYELTDRDIETVKAEIKAIEASAEDFVFNSNCTRGTCFLASDGKIHIKGNIFPDENSAHPRDRLSVRAVLAHEYYGHRPYRGQYLREDSDTSPNAINMIMSRAWADEFRASYMAARNAPNLSQEDRAMLILDALSRAEEAGVSIKYNDFIRRVLYG